MLTKRERILFELLVVAYHEILPFFHQLKPQFLCLLQAEREVFNLAKYMILQFDRKVRNPAFFELNVLAPPMTLLARDVGSRYDADVRIN